MYLRAGVFSLGLLLLSRALGLLRESAQAAAFGSTGMGDAVIVMFTLPDLLVGMLISGALAYVLLPAWAQQKAATQAAGQKNSVCAGRGRACIGRAALAMQGCCSAGAGARAGGRYERGHPIGTGLERRGAAAGHAGGAVGDASAI